MENLTLISQIKERETSVDYLIEKATAAKANGATKVVLDANGITSFIKELTAEEIKAARIAVLQAEIDELNGE